MISTTLFAKTSDSNLVHTVDLSKQYHVGTAPLDVLKKINFSVKDGEFVAIMGPSGSGKSTLLHILGCLERPSQGQYYFNDTDVLKATDRELSYLRATQIGFVFQTYNLVAALRDCRKSISSACIGLVFATYNVFSFTSLMK